MRKYRDADEDELMKRLFILDKELKEMGIHVRDSEERAIPDTMKDFDDKGGEMTKDYLEAALNSLRDGKETSEKRETKCCGCGKPVLIPKDYDDRAFCVACGLDYVRHMEKEKACLMCGKKIEGENMGPCADCAKNLGLEK